MISILELIIITDISTFNTIFIIGVVIKTGLLSSTGLGMSVKMKEGDEDIHTTVINFNEY